jgi:GTPase KRas
MRTGEGFLICFSLIDKKTIDECQIFIDQIKKVKDVDHFPGILVGCKCDLIEERQIPMQDILKFSNDNSIPYIETSSKNNVKVDDCFLEIVKEIDKFKKINQSNSKVKNNGGCIIS